MSLGSNLTNKSINSTEGYSKWVKFRIEDFPLTKNGKPYLYASLTTGGIRGLQSTKKAVFFPSKVLDDGTVLVPRDCVDELESDPYWETRFPVALEEVADEAYAVIKTEAPYGAKSFTVVGDKQTASRLAKAKNRNLEDDDKHTYIYRKMDETNSQKYNIPVNEGVNKMSIVDEILALGGKSHLKEMSAGENYSLARPNSQRLLEQLDDYLDASSLAEELINWLPDDEVGRFAEENGYFPDEDDFTDDEDQDDDGELEAEESIRLNYYLIETPDGIYKVNGKIALFDTLADADDFIDNNGLIDAVAMFADEDDIAEGYKMNASAEEGFIGSDKDSYLREVAHGDFETGQTYSKDDFGLFKKICSEDGYEVTEDDFDKYFQFTDESKGSERSAEESLFKSKLTLSVFLSSAYDDDGEIAYAIADQLDRKYKVESVSKTRTGAKAILDITDSINFFKTQSGWQTSIKLLLNFLRGKIVEINQSSKFGSIKSLKISISINVDASLFRKGRAESLNGYLVYSGELYSSTRTFDVKQLKEDVNEDNTGMAAHKMKEVFGKHKKTGFESNSGDLTYGEEQPSRQEVTLTEAQKEFLWDSLDMAEIYANDSENKFSEFETAKDCDWKLIPIEDRDYPWTLLIDGSAWDDITDSLAEEVIKVGGNTNQTEVKSLDEKGGKPVKSATEKNRAFEEYEKGNIEAGDEYMREVDRLEKIEDNSGGRIDNSEEIERLELAAKEEFDQIEKEIYEAMNRNSITNFQASVSDSISRIGSLSTIQLLLDSELADSFQDELFFIKNTYDLSDTQLVSQAILDAGETLLEDSELERAMEILKNSSEEENEEEFGEYEEPEDWSEVDQVEEGEVGEPVEGEEITEEETELEEEIPEEEETI